MAEIDKAHAPGGMYRVGDRVVNAEGKDLGQEGIDTLDQIDAEAKEAAEKALVQQNEAQAMLASGGLAGVLAQALGIAGKQQAEAPKAKAKKADEPSSPAVTLDG